MSYGDTYNDPDNIPDEDRFERGSYKEFRKYVKNLISESDLKQSTEAFEKESAVVSEVIRNALKIVKSQPFLTAFLIWSKTTREGRIDYVDLLLEKEMVPFSDKRGNLLLINQFKTDHLITIIDRIRSRKDCDILTKEELVCYFLDFSHWLSRETFSSTFKISDPDQILTQSRTLSFGGFISLLGKLDEKFQVIAKLLYFGGCTLSQVLSLSVQDIDFDNKIIMFDERQMSYPLHVFEGLKSLVAGKRYGKVFIGRNNAPLNPATVFRNFKEAALKARLNDSFTPKDLHTNKI